MMKRVSFMLPFVIFLAWGIPGPALFVSVRAQAPRPEKSPNREPQLKDFPLNPPQTAAAPPVRKDSSLDVDRIIHRFAAKESEFRDARANYTFRQEVKVQTLDYDDRPNGEFLRISEIQFTDKGQRTERIIRFPPSTLQGLMITPTDLRDLASIQPFSLTTEELAQYIITYAGKEKVDELNTYTFDVRPKKIPEFKQGGERFFTGRIWVDDRDLMIVKTYGKAVPEGKERFPRFETYRENIDGKYWFPTYTYAKDVLQFPNGDIPMTMEVRYTNYKQFKTDVRILDDEPAPKKP